MLNGQPLRTGDTGVSGLREADILVKSITDLRYHIRSVMVFIEVQLPLPFIQIVSAVVWAFMVQLILMCSSYVAFGRQHRDGPSVTTGYITIVLYSFALLGLLRLFHVLSNPMDSTHKSNFPHETYMREYVQNLHTIRAEGFAFVAHGDVFRHRSSSKYPLSMRINTENSGLSDSLNNPNHNHNHNKSGTIAEETNLTSRSSLTTAVDDFPNHYDGGRASDDARSSFCSVTPLVDENGERYHVPDYDSDDDDNGRYRSSNRGQGREEERAGDRGAGHHRFVLPRVQVPSAQAVGGSFWDRFNVSPPRLDVIPPPPAVVSSTTTQPSTSGQGPLVPPA